MSNSKVVGIHFFFFFSGSFAFVQCKGSIFFNRWWRVYQDHFRIDHFLFQFFIDSIVVSEAHLLYIQPFFKSLLLDFQSVFFSSFFVLSLSSSLSFPLSLSFSVLLSVALSAFQPFRSTLSLLHSLHIASHRKHIRVI